jgi:hypothetical protein
LLGGEMTAVGLGGWGLFHDGFLRCRILYQPAPVFPISSEALQPAGRDQAIQIERQNRGPAVPNLGLAGSYCLWHDTSVSEA